jgi:hypothetical protein
MVKNWGQIAFLSNKTVIMDRLRRIVEKGGSKNTKAFGSGHCQSAVAYVELSVDVF